MGHIAQLSLELTSINTFEKSNIDEEMEKIISFLRIEWSLFVNLLEFPYLLMFYAMFG